VLVAARKGGRSPLRLARDLVLHEPDGPYTPATEAILRDGAPLPL
jgi:tRNA1(Val) A37 N6-methylase TrmN6